MGKEVTFDYSKAAGFVSAEEMANFKTTVMTAKETLINKTGAGNDFRRLQGQAGGCPAVCPGLPGVSNQRACKNGL